MKNRACSLAVAVAFVCAPLLCASAFCIRPASAQDWNSSPSNWKNSPSNWDNSPTKWGNDRIVRDNDGDAKGYAVPKEDGGVNFYDFDGNRRGYLPEEE